MSVDSLIRDHYWKGFFEAKNRAKALEAKGDFKAAADSCNRCARLLKQMGETDPKSKGRYEEQAKEWEAKAQRLRSPSYIQLIKAPDIGGPEGKDDTIDSMVKEFEGRIEKLISSQDVSWSDIGGLEDEKNLLKEAIFYAVAPPETDVKIPRLQRILLYGPPGTGKTMLARAASANLKATFFDAPLDELLSRYVGDSPRLVSALFRVAARRSPSVVFLDEVEALVERRESGKYVASGVVQTFLRNLDGFKNRDAFVLFMAASNKPWMIDEAILSRFEKRIFIPLPDATTREAIFRIHSTAKGFVVHADLSMMASTCEGYSGRDIEYVCNEAARMMLRRANPNAAKMVDQVGSLDELRTRKYRVLPITEEELLEAVEKVKPVTSEDDLKRYEEWGQRYGFR